MPSDSEKRAIAEASKQMEQRAPRVAINIEQTKDKPCQVSPSHADALGWQIRLTNALGTSSHEFVDIELGRLVTVFRDREGRIDARAVNAALGSG
jgi:hypothetical protein